MKIMVVLGVLCAVVLVSGVRQYSETASLRESNAVLAHRLSESENASERQACRSNLQEISGSVMAYRVATRSTFTDDFQKLGKYLDASSLICPKDGMYRIDLVPFNSYTVHCSVNEHDAGAAGEPLGYSPGLNRR